MTREEMAFQFFILMLREGAEVSLHPRLGEKQIKACFTLAETFEHVAKENENPKIDPTDPVAVQKAVRHYIPPIVRSKS